MLKTKHINLWTSDLEYSENIEKVVEVAVKDLSSKIIFDRNTKTTKILDETYEFPGTEADYKWKPGIVDYTCIAKGYFMQYVVDHLPQKDMEYFINFGGDICCNYKDEYFVESKYNNYEFSTKWGPYLFCSTNREREGHIPDAVYDFTVVAGRTPLLGDFIATKALVNDVCPGFLQFDKGGKLVGKVYIASPFFNKTDCEIRDAMASNFPNKVRPDLLNPNIEGDLHKDEELARKIRKDNLDAIDACEFLVFPMNTTDLGTLYEVGYAIRRGKTILRYDYIRNVVQVISTNVPLINPVDTYTLDLNKLGAGILLGYWYDNNEHLQYYLGDSADNIMLMENKKVDKPTELYPSYLDHILTDSVYHLNTLTSGS